MVKAAKKEDDEFAGRVVLSLASDMRIFLETADRIKVHFNVLAKHMGVPVL